mgnify:CR=1 FL=1
MIKPVTFDRPDTCPHCGGARALELYNHKNIPMHYSIMIDQHVNLKDKVVDLAYIKCKKCGKEFFPRWQSDKILGLAEIRKELQKMNHDIRNLLLG